MNVAFIIFGSIGMLVTLVMLIVYIVDFYKDLKFLREDDRNWHRKCTDCYYWSDNRCRMVRDLQDECLKREHMLWVKKDEDKL